jgi:3-oxoacyl-(acyl-carrier-protein) synthase
MLYIEKVIVEDQYDVVNFFHNICQTVEYNRAWPLITNIGHHDEKGFATAFTDFVSEKKVTRPSNLLESGVESVERIVGRELGMHGPVMSVSASCTSGAYAFYLAEAVSRTYKTPVIIASAAQMTPNSFSEFWFKSLRAHSPDTGIPFDKNSKGFRAGSSQTFYIVSATPINPVAQIRSIDMFTQTGEHTHVGSIEQIEERLFSKLDVSGIGWWNAHAPGTPIGDAAEYQIFSNVMKDRDVPISSLKGRCGHSLRGSYHLEVGLGIMYFQMGMIPGNTGIQDPIVDDPRIITSDTVVRSKTFLKFNMGFGGKNVVSIVDVL